MALEATGAPVTTEASARLHIREAHASRVGRPRHDRSRSRDRQYPDQSERSRRQLTPPRSRRNHTPNASARRTQEVGPPDFTAEATGTTAAFLSVTTSGVAVARDLDPSIAVLVMVLTARVLHVGIHPMFNPGFRFTIQQKTKTNSPFDVTLAETFAFSRLLFTPRYLWMGAPGFRPSPAELRVHQTARVGPRPMLSALDRVSFILHEEMRRGQYCVIKVTTKMIFAVDFDTKPLDHFFPPSVQGGGGRTVVHDSSTWSSGDTVPGGSIASMDDLRAPLCMLMLPPVCSTMIRLAWFMQWSICTHTYFRGSLCLSIRARAIIATDSPDYARLVRQVIDHGLFSTWAQAKDTRAHRSDSPRSHVRMARSHNSSQRAPRQPRQQKSPVPDTVTRQIPTRDGKS
ncbi:LOW QUALITY PROTEIN: hypothetical protein PHMEG_00026845, partial [Phytophthora megakarya]